MSEAAYFDSGDLQATKQFKAWKVDRSTRLGFQADWSNTGSPVGKFSFVVSDHPEAQFADGSLNPAAKWSPLDSPVAWDAKQPGAAGNPTNGEYGLADLGHLWVAPVYTRTSGGTASSIVTIRGYAKT